jgi:hypothetical protein
MPPSRKSHATSFPPGDRDTIISILLDVVHEMHNRRGRVGRPSMEALAVLNHLGDVVELMTPLLPPKGLAMIQNKYTRALGIHPDY